MAKQPYRGLPDMIADHIGRPRMSDEEWAEYQKEWQEAKEFDEKYSHPFAAQWKAQRGLGRRITMQQQMEMLRDFEQYLKENGIKRPSDKHQKNS